MLGLLLTLAVVIGVVYFLVTKYLKDRQDSSKTVSPRGCCCSHYLSGNASAYQAYACCVCSRSSRVAW